MPYDEKPDAEYVQKFAKRMLPGRWSAQDTLDEKVYKMVRRQTELDGAIGSNAQGREVRLRALRTGITETMLSHDTATLAPEPTISFANPESDYNLQQKIDYVLEPWCAGVSRQAQVEEVHLQAIRDLRWFGRSWRAILPLPRLWTDKKYTGYVKELSKLTDSIASSKSGGNNGLNEQRREVKAKIAEFKRRNFPIIERYYGARLVWPQLSVERRLPEAVIVRRMTLADIKSDYGDDALPGPDRAYSDEHSTEERDVYIYFNHYCQVTVVGSDSDPKQAHYFEHGMEKNPLILMETYILSDDPSGIRWLPPYEPLGDLVEALDEIMTDLRLNHRENTRTPLVFSADPEVRQQTNPEMMGTPEKMIKYQPGGIIGKYTNEDLEIAPVPIIQPQSLELMSSIKDQLQLQALNPAEYGQLKGEQSAVGIATTLQNLNRRLDPYAATIEKAELERVDSMFECVKVLNKDFPDDPDKVYVVTEKHGRIGVGPKDVEGMAELAKVRIPDLLPINKNQALDLHIGAVQNGYFDPEFSMENFMGIENAGKVIKGWKAWQVQVALMEDLITRVKQYAGMLSAAVPQASIPEIAQQLTTMPPAALAPLASRGLVPGMEGMQPAGPLGGPMPMPPPPMDPMAAAGMPGTVPGSPGALMQGASNVRRAGTGQAMSEVGANQIVSGPGGI